MCYTSTPVSLSTLSVWMFVHVCECIVQVLWLMSLAKKKSCIKTAIILAFISLFCNTLRQRGDTITYSSHCHHAGCLMLQSSLTSHISLMFMLYIFHIIQFSTILRTSTKLLLYGTHTVLLVVFLQKQMNKLHDWNPCQCRNDIHLFFKCGWWTKWVAYQVRWTNWKEYLKVWQCVR